MLDGIIPINLFDATVPQFSKFITKVNTGDLARSNLFLVRFSNLLNPIMGDGVVDFPQGDGLLGKLSGIAESGINNAISNMSDSVINQFAGSSVGGFLTGAYSPKLLGSILPGEYASQLVPAGLDLNTDIALLCKAAKIPGVSLDTATSQDNRKPYTYAKGRKVENLVLTFYATPNISERNTFMAWMESVHNPLTNEYGFYDTIIRDIEILPLTRQGQSKSIIKADGCFPVRVGSIALDSDSSNSVITFDVEFSVSTVAQHSSFGNPILDGASEAVGGLVGEGVSGVLGKFFD